MIAVLIVIAASWLGYVIFTYDKVSVTVKFAPFAATVRLDETVIRNNSSNYITPGNYHLKVEYENFETIERDIVVEEGTKYLYGNMNPANEAGEAYMQEHMEEFYEVQGIAGELATDAGLLQRSLYPIVDKLPVKDPYFNIGYNLNDEGGLDVTVEAAIAYRQLAVSRLLEIMKKEDFGKYNIVFYDLDNPYAGKFVDNDETDPAEYIKKGFAGVDVDFTVNGGVEENGYYYAYLRYYFRKYVNVIYRVVLEGGDGEWGLVANPEPLLTTFNTPDVPLEIIDEVNRL